jgi:hypothetical protein
VLSPGRTRQHVHPCGCAATKTASAQSPNLRAALFIHYFTLQLQCTFFIGNTAGAGQHCLIRFELANVRGSLLLVLINTNNRTTLRILNNRTLTSFVKDSSPTLADYTVMGGSPDTTCKTFDML